MPVALPGVGPALPTAATTTTTTLAPAAGAPAVVHGPAAAPGSSALHGSGASAPQADAAGGAAETTAPDFKTLLKAGLGRAASAAADKALPGGAAPDKKTPVHATAAGEALAAAMAVLVPPLPGGLPVARTAPPAAQSAPAASASQGITVASAGKLPLAGNLSLSLSSALHSHAAAAQSDTAAAAQSAAANNPANDPAKIAADGKSLPAAVATDIKSSHPPAASVAPGDTSLLLPAGNTAAPASVAVAAASASLPGNPPVTSPVFADALGERMVWMSKNDLQAAHLQLNPPELGPLSIHLTVSDNQVSAYFVSAHEPVREAIAAALPRLQEMMSGSGMTLGQANVGSESFANANANANANGGQGQPSRAPAWPDLAASGSDGTDAAPAAWRPLSRGRVDTFV